MSNVLVVIANPGFNIGPIWILIGRNAEDPTVEVRVIETFQDVVLYEQGIELL